MKKLILSAVAALLTSAALMAQSVPEYMQYQTVVRNAQGQVLTNTEIGVKITITDEVGTEPFVETHAVTTDEVGIALIKIGSGNGNSGTLGDYFRSPEGIEKMMKVEIDPTGGTNYSLISGESQLLTVPFAFRANTAYKADEANTAEYASTANTANTATTAGKANAVGDLKLAKARITITNSSNVYDFTVNIGGKTATVNKKTSATIELDLLTYTPVYCTLTTTEDLYDINSYGDYYLRTLSVQYDGFMAHSYIYAPYNRREITLLAGPFTKAYNAGNASSINTGTISISDRVN